MIVEANKASLISHLDQYSKALPPRPDNLPAAILELALKCKNEVIVGTNARAFALLSALKRVITLHKPTPGVQLSRDVSEILERIRNYLKKVRRLSDGIDSIFVYLKSAQISNMSEEQAKDLLLTKINDFIEQKIMLADDLIIKNSLDLIKEGDTILTYGRCYVIERLLLESAKKGKNFNLIVVDNPPFFEAKPLYVSLVSAGVNAIYTLITGVAYFMKRVSKVFLGASSMLSNGALVSRVGSAMVGCLAHSYRKPLLVFCETYKFSERAQLDSLSENELADPDKLWQKQEYPGVQTINLRYDMTPRNYIHMIVTETGLIPPTSIPVILREFNKYQGQNVSITKPSSG